MTADMGGALPPTDSGDPQVTIILPTYRRPKLLRRAVTSVLRQTYPSFRLVVLDDESNDATEEVATAFAAADFRVRYYRHPVRVGPMRNFAFGMELVRTPYFAFLSDDDMLCPGYLQAAVDALADHTDAGFAATRVIGVDDRGYAVQTASDRFAPGTYKPPSGLLALISNRHFEWTGLVFRQSVVASIGKLDMRTGLSADVDFQLRIASTFPYLVVDTVGAVFFYGDWTTSVNADPVTTATGWRAISNNLARAPISDDYKRLANLMIQRRFGHELFALGIRAARIGNRSRALDVSRILGSEYKDPMRGAVLRGIAALCVAAWMRRLISWAVVLRRPYHRLGWSRSPVKANELLPYLPWELGEPVGQGRSVI